MIYPEILSTPSTEFQPELRGERLILKRSTSDIQTIRTLAKLYKKNHAALKPFKDWANVKNIEDVRKLLILEKKQWELRQAATYYIYERDTCIGCVAIHCSGKLAEPHTFIDIDYHKKGYGREVIRIIEQEFFKIGYEEIIHNCNLKNPAFNALSANTQRANYIQRDTPKFARTPDTKDKFASFVKTYAMYQKENR